LQSRHGLVRNFRAAAAKAGADDADGIGCPDAAGFETFGNGDQILVAIGMFKFGERAEREA
jgi:hypothetical protein